MFTFRMATGGVQQDVFVFVPGAHGHLFQLATALPIGSYAPYTYYYGSGAEIGRVLGVRLGT